MVSHLQGEACKFNQEVDKTYYMTVMDDINAKVKNRSNLLAPMIVSLGLEHGTKVYHRHDLQDH